ncbi:MAG: shikimate dehydrogenase [Planctomycetota bacterium]
MTLTVSILAAHPKQLVEFGALAVAGADWVEVRLDHAIGQDLGDWKRAVLALQKPFIVSLHGPDGLGTRAGAGSEHTDLLREAAGWGAEFVDVDFRFASELGELPSGCGRILSMHRTQAPCEPWAGAYERLVSQAIETDRIKFVVAAQSALQGLQVMTWARDLPARKAGRLLFCMGESVGFTRFLARAQGDPWMYAAPTGVVDSPFQITAKGQYSLAQVAAVNPPQPGIENPRYWAVLGHPINHSLSPEIHGAALSAAREGIFYMAIDPGASTDWESWMRAATDYGFEGFAVTAPFKSQALASASIATDAAREVGAANTLALRDGLWHAHNTDVGGIQSSLEEAGALHGKGRALSRVPVASEMHGKKALILGAGGAARAARVACIRLGMEVDVCVRRTRAGELWVSEFGGRTWCPWEVRAGAYDVLVNTTPLGWGGRGMPLPPSALDSNVLALDAVYYPAETPLMAGARMQGATALGGSSWFLSQAAQQYDYLLGSEPDRGVMAQALRAGLARQHAESSPPKCKPLALIGMRAVGKTTLGRALARALGFEFVDADGALLESYLCENPDSAWSTPGQILQGLGLEEFRRLEQTQLERLLERGSRVVIATGGGVVETPGCRALLRDQATCIWLDLPPALLMERLARDLGDRPGLTPLGPIEEVPEVYQRRLALYGGLAHFALRGDCVEPGLVPEQLIESLRTL